MLLLLLFDSLILQRLREHQESSSELCKVLHRFIIDGASFKYLQRLRAGRTNACSGWFRSVHNKTCQALFSADQKSRSDVVGAFLPQVWVHGGPGNIRQLLCSHCCSHLSLRSPPPSPPGCWEHTEHATAGAWGSAGAWDRPGLGFQGGQASHL